MAKTTLHITIPEPCHEDWSKMSPTQCGAFCNACQKEVIDFSLMSEAEIVDKLSKASGKVCGRIASDKLNRELIKHEPDHAWYSWKKWAVAAGVLLGVGDAKANMPTDSTKTVMQDSMQVKLQDVVVTPGSRTHCPAVSPYPSESPPLLKIKSVISGRVLDEQDKPLPLAVVSVAGTEYNATTNENGEYSITLNDTLYNREVELTVTFAGIQVANTTAFANSGIVNFNLSRRHETVLITQGNIEGLYIPVKKRSKNPFKKHKN